LVIYRAGQQLDYPGIAHDLAVEPETAMTPLVFTRPSGDPYCW
jgi:hypothetical protein